MAPNNTETPLMESPQTLHPRVIIKSNKSTINNLEYEPTIIWSNVFFISLFHIIAFFGFFYAIAHCKIMSIVTANFVGMAGGFGVTGGVHRLWSHRSYKAKLPLQIILLICYSIAGQNTIYDWVRDHRVHHKFSETDADPHNAKRGFFFAHVGWLMQKKHPEVLRKGQTVDMTDITSDPLLMFHTKYFTTFKLLLCFILPILFEVYVIGENFFVAVLIMAFVRYICGLNFTWLVNSASHIWGNKPYDKRISPAENLSVAILAMGEGWHNYHHVFPWDYKAAELGNYRFNVTTALIDMFAKIGWAYDLKYPSKELIIKTAERNGDGTHHHEEVPCE
uniref:Fatty acid desaturase domain-containing protein n=1 Tax=Clastoptera arizonana TaxID=38151 RepID=A0A1B6DCJ1_9HEMI